MSNVTNFGLDRITVEHRPISQAHAFICVLPPPPSVNSMYGNRRGSSPGRGRFKTKEYAEWIEFAGLRLSAAKPPKYSGQVWIAIQYSDHGNGDIDNKAKSVLDLLVAHKVIKDDSRTYVRELRLSWGNNAGARVEVRPFPFDTGRAA
jgi:Holliday junction resolvase RusA-like endonuclease